MITVNNKKMEWRQDLSFDDIFTFLGYRIKNPHVVIRVNGRIVKRAARNSFKIPDNAKIDVIKALYGG